MMAFIGYLVMFSLALLFGNVAYNEWTISPVYRDNSLLFSTSFLSTVCCVMAYSIAHYG